MTDSANSSPLSHKDLIEQARGIIMNRFDLDAAQALKVLRRMSQATKTQMWAVAEQVVNYNEPMAALRRLEEDALLRLTPETER
jgi:AmiR/NasT family two-component response regulator